MGINGSYKGILGAFGLVFLLLAIMMPASAQTIPVSETYYVDFFITLKNANSGEIIPSMPVDIVWIKQETGSTINLTKYIDKRGTISYRISPGKWGLQLYVDNTSTPQFDYFGESEYTITDDIVTRAETLYVVPIGSLEVVVSDSSDNLVVGADVDFKCRSHRKSAKTDRFGSYKADNLPAGECKISAASGNLVGSAMATVEMGRTKSAEVVLSEEVKVASLYYAYYILGAAILAAIFFLLYKVVKKRIRKEVKEEIVKKVKIATKARADKKHAEKEKAAKEHKAEAKQEKEDKGELNPRARDIMKTLNDKEQTVVNLLVKSENKSTQATIRNETGIPKTTLARIFQSLESKKVLKVETIGKLKKVELTGWFLGKD